MIKLDKKEDSNNNEEQRQPKKTIRRRTTEEVARLSISFLSQIINRMNNEQLTLSSSTAHNTLTLLPCDIV